MIMESLAFLQVFTIDTGLLEVTYSWYFSSVYTTM